MNNELTEDNQLSLGGNRHQPKSEGAFLASAAGDALGWPQEIMGKKIHPRETTAQTEFFSWVRLGGGRFYRHEQEIKPGEYSDDTQLMLAVARCRTLTTSGWWETFTRTELPLWSLYERGGGASTKRSARSWLQGVPPWEDNESGQSASYFNAGGNGVAMRILPHAIYFAGRDDPSQLIRDIFLDGISTHGHPRALVGAIAYGFAAWWFLRSQKTIGFGEIIDVLLRQVDLWGELPESPSSDDSWTNAAATAFPGLYGDHWSGALEEMVGLLNSVQTGLKAGAISNDEAVLRDIGAYGRTKGAGTITAAAALYLAARYAAQPAQGILRAAFGHGTDTDTIGAMVGGLTGCLAGKDWIPQEWYSVQDCKYIQQLAAAVAQGPDRQVSERKPPVVVGRRQIDAIRRTLTDEKQTNLTLDGVRRAKVVAISQPQPVSKSNTIKTWAICVEDGQTIYVNIQSRIPQASRGADVGGRVGGIVEPRTKHDYEHDDPANRGGPTNPRIWEIQYAGSPKTLWSQVKPTPRQLAIAAQLGVQVSPDDTFAVVASNILEEVGHAIGCPPHDVSDRQHELAKELGVDIADCESSWGAFVRIKEAIQLANSEAARRMELKPGDKVVNRVGLVEQSLQEALGERWESVSRGTQREFEISSIREDGQVFFKGGGQAPARHLNKVTTPDSPQRGK